MTARAGSIVVPEWQEDSEVSACPLCKRQFHFLFRKHHCRRCGRVICNECSPHRITLPKQYVVRPQYEAIQYRLEIEEQSELGEENPALGGGETVRVCNPCVPDPNYGPPPQKQGELPTPDTSRAPHLPLPPPPAGSDQQTAFHSAQRSPERIHPERYRSTTTTSTTPTARAQDARAYYTRRASSQAIPAHQVLSARFASRANRALSSAEQPHLPVPPLPPTTSRPIPNLNHPPRPNPSGSAPSTYTRPLPRPPPRGATTTTDPRPRSRGSGKEQDECPVCGTQDPPFGPTGTQTARESHISTCISSHLHFGTPSPAAASAVVAALGTPPPPPPGQTSVLRHPGQRMLVYHATEKDCLGEGSECVICFEDFSVGEEMGRLECLCKFHRGCIRGWWERGGKWGCCPTHVLHE